MSETISTASAPPPPVSSQPVPTLLELCAAFALIALCGFGGVLAWSRRMLVEERRLDDFRGVQRRVRAMPIPSRPQRCEPFGRIRPAYPRRARVGGRAAGIAGAAVRHRDGDRPHLCAVRRDRCVATHADGG